MSILSKMEFFGNICGCFSIWKKVGNELGMLGYIQCNKMYSERNMRYLGLDVGYFFGISG